MTNDGSNEPSGNRENAVPRFKIDWLPDRSQITLQMLPDNPQANTVTMDLEGLTHHIAQLGVARAAMVEGKPPPTFENTVIVYAVNPIWFTQPNRERRGSELIFVHPNVGPMGFFLPLNESAHLCSLLVTQVSEFLRESPVASDSSAS